jgi:hypothetical protein
MMSIRHTLVSVCVVGLLACCKPQPEKPAAPPANPIKARVEPTRQAADDAGKAMQASEDRMRAAAAEAAGEPADSAAKQP